MSRRLLWVHPHSHTRWRGARSEHRSGCRRYAPRRVSGYFSTFESYEREYQRNLANDRAGRVTYPGTALRELRGPSTVEQRRAAYERFAAWRAKQEGEPPTVRWPQQLRRLQPAALAVLFGMMGWTLAGVGSVTFGRAALWWALIYLGALAFSGLPRALNKIPLAAPPYSYALPFFGALTIALVIASWRRTDESRV